MGCLQRWVETEAENRLENSQHSMVWPAGTAKVDGNRKECSIRKTGAQGGADERHDGFAQLYTYGDLIKSGNTMSSGMMVGADWTQKVPSVAGFDI